MQYLIDTADPNEIEEVMAYGIDGITANTTMYRRQGIGVRSFVARWAERKPSFLSGEVIGSFEQMEERAKELLAIDPDIVIKINFSKEGLRLAHRLHQQGVRTAMTLLFTVTQAVAAMQAGCDYLFFFIGRNEEQGWDGMEAIAQLQALVDACGAETKVVAASIKNLYQLEQLARHHIDCAAIPYALYMRSLQHPLTESGAKTFIEDYEQNEQNKKA